VAIRQEGPVAQRGWKVIRKKVSNITLQVLFRIEATCRARDRNLRLKFPVEGDAKLTHEENLEANRIMQVTDGSKVVWEAKTLMQVIVYDRDLNGCKVLWES
jgi:hypothetical protein